MNDNIIQISEVYVGQLFVQDSLHFIVERFALCKISFRASLIEQLTRSLRIVVVLAHVSVVSPALRRKDARGGLGLVTPKVMNDGLAMDGVGDGLAHAHVL